MSTVEESVVSFGPDQTLVGILTTPSADTPHAGIGCLLLNTGVNHRIGPRRVNVKAARRLAGSGIPCLRFDMTGIGDSKASSGREDYRQQQLADMRAALDQFQASTGLSRFVIFGVCTGAANALTLALADARVVGVLMFDGHIFPDKLMRLERKVRRWLAFPFNASLRRTYGPWRDWTGWLRSPTDANARARVVARLRGRPLAPESESTEIFAAGAQRYGAGDFARDLQTLLDRGVDVYIMHSAMLNIVDRNRNLLAQLRGQPCLERVRYRFWPDVDHTLTLLDAQRRLLQALEQWALEVSTAQRASPASPARGQAGEPARKPGIKPNCVSA